VVIRNSAVKRSWQLVQHSGFPTDQYFYSSSFYYPSVLAVDKSGMVYVSDYGAQYSEEIQAVNGSSALP